MQCSLNATENFSFLMKWSENSSVLRFDFGYDSDADLQPTLDPKIDDNFKTNNKVTIKPKARAVVRIFVK
jgi:hypothetical protein